MDGVDLPRCRLCEIEHARGSSACPLARVGQRLGDRYHIERLIGVGGMGAVYEAENLALGRRVAVKMLHPRMAARPEAVERFRREARSLAKLAHPGFAQIYALDTLPGGELAIEMELLDGTGLDQLADGTQPIARVVGWLDAALAALAVAHDARLVHRDLKPENLFLCAGPGEHVKILDFGIARADNGAALSAEGALYGTVAYASPEQIGNSGEVTARSDVYSMGATAYELLVGRRVVDAEALTAAVLAIAEDRVSRHPREVRGEVPPWLDAVVARALERDPQRRFADAHAMLAALRAQASAAATPSAATPSAAAPRDQRGEAFAPPPSRAADVVTLEPEWEHARAAKIAGGAPPIAEPPRRRSGAGRGIAVLVGLALVAGAGAAAAVWLMPHRARRAEEPHRGSGSVEIRVRAEGSAAIRIDGAPAGAAPLTLQHRIGTQPIRIDATIDGRRQTRLVIPDRDQEIDFAAP